MNYTGIELIALERNRLLFDAAHDDAQPVDILLAMVHQELRKATNLLWPPQRDALVRAGALLAALIDSKEGEHHRAIEKYRRQELGWQETTLEIALERRWPRNQKSVETWRCLVLMPVSPDVDDDARERYHRLMFDCTNPRHNAWATFIDFDPAQRIATYSLSLAASARLYDDLGVLGWSRIA